MSNAIISKTELIFKNNLIRLRQEQNLSKKKLSELLGYDYSYYYKLENLNKSINPRFDTYERIANFFHIEVFKLFIDYNNNQI